MFPSLGFTTNPLLMIIMYERVLTLQLSKSVTTVRFTDDIQIGIVAKRFDKKNIYHQTRKSSSGRIMLHEFTNSVCL